MENFDIIKNHATLRSLVVCQLTLYNNRRGNKPYRMLLSEWRDQDHDVNNKVWVSADSTQDMEDGGEWYLTGRYMLAYMVRGRSMCLF